ncbi:hypothetical protein HQ403_01075 [Candidatus Kaiserbacteria bacterium]|nr:hypothetical protein [Candidatus Kaiserbacteria bacterium]
MKDIASELPQDLHHAYVIEGGEDSKEKLLHYIEGLGITTVGNPDVHVREYDVFGIDDGRAIQGLESTKAFALGKKIFILNVNSITREAQNALLKTLEEPTEGTHFFLLVPSAGVLLETLLSRVQVIRMHNSVAGDSSISPLLAKQFLSSTGAERLALIADIIETKDKQEALSLVNGLERELYEQSGFQKNISGVENIPTEAFEALQSVRSYLQDRSSSVKILLEHLSVTLPRVT